MDPYRVEAFMPESDEVIAARKAAQERTRQMRWIVYTFGTPAAGCLVIGQEWGAMSTALAVCSIVSLTLVTVGIFCAMTFICEWK
jgi:pheromone shutdown protein TraB